jgi:hypothetical protein
MSVQSLQIKGEVMTRSEKVAVLIKARQLYTYEEWYEVVGYVYSLMNMKHSPAEEYAIYVNDTLKAHGFEVE